MLPNFLIIGAQKSGSTFFLKCLADHPDVFMPPGEVRFFEDPEYTPDAIHRLTRLFQNVSGQTALGIKRPGYLSRPECPARIHHHLPQAKLIAILRDPIDRAISAYFHLMKCGFIPIRPLAEGMTKLIDGEYQVSHLKAAEILDFGFYHRHLTRYLQYFRRAQMLILLFESIKAEPQAAIQCAYRFIAVNDSYVPKPLQAHRRPNPNPGVYSLARLRLLNLRNRFAYTYNYARTRRYAKARLNLIDRALGKLVDALDGALFSRLYRAHQPEPIPELRERLLNIYADDITRLEDLLGQSLAGWRAPAPLRA
ncbi:MAG TPA: sulfotransferase domain-containing protein [Anaerolineae bacterium]|nr:sulfotransferase domain-containing protein [Anaerolineae bacterium]